MKSGLLTAKSLKQFCTLFRINSISYQISSVPVVIVNSQFKPHRLFRVCCAQNNGPVSSPADSASESLTQLKIAVGSPSIPSFVPGAKLSLSDQAFFLLAFIACTAMGRAAISLSKLADTARKEFPSTMAAIRLSGMEISDLTLELNDLSVVELLFSDEWRLIHVELSQEIADGVINKSAQAVQAVEAGIRQIGSLARHQTMSMIQERASLPVISLQPVVAGAAKKTSRAVGQATKTFMSIISRGEFSSDHEQDKTVDRLDIVCQ